MSTLKQLEDKIFEAGVYGGQVTSEAIEAFRVRQNAFKMSLMCWTQAIQLYFNGPKHCEQHSFKDLANYFARPYEIPADVWEQVSDWFDWDSINKELR